MQRLIYTHLAIIIKDAAEIEETRGTEVRGHLLRLACTGDMLHLRTVHHPKISRDLKGAWSLGLSLGLGLWRQTCGLGSLVLGLFRGFLMSTKGYKHRLLLLLSLLLLRKGIIRPWWLHTMGDSGRRGREMGYGVVGVCDIVRENRRWCCGKVGAGLWVEMGLWSLCGWYGGGRGR